MSADAISPSLSGLLRRETADLHRTVEQTGIMPAFLRRQLERPAYCALLRNLHAIYAALEPALARHALHPWLSPLCLPALPRVEGLVADLGVLHGPDWATQIAVLPAARAYVERIAAIAVTAPPNLIAHAYVRYLGDLSGGQVLQRIVIAALQPPAGKGTRFYEFGAPGATALARQFRDGLDVLPLSVSAIAAIVDEARLGFALHVRLFGELEAGRNGSAA